MKGNIDRWHRNFVIVLMSKVKFPGQEIWIWMSFVGGPDIFGRLFLGSLFLGSLSCDGCYGSTALKLVYEHYQYWCLEEFVVLENLRGRSRTFDTSD